jgi:phenylpropionate dioxygenase-like ring-hydroxylating dioxygenase large terminal subunit
MVPERGDYHVLNWRSDGQALVRSGDGNDGIALMSNVCRHRQAIMLKGRGNTPNIICPMHRWTYDLKGALIGAPQFPQTPCLHLKQTPLQSWNGMLFAGSRHVAADMASLSLRHFDFSGFVYDRTEIHECAYNWKSFLEVYLEDYHVGPFHPGLGNFVSCDDLSWQFDDRFSVQSVGVNKGLAKPGSKAYERWHKAVRDYYGEDKEPPFGAIWLTMYPNVMIEWYPHVLVVSTLVPRGPQQTTNVIEFYYPEDIAWFRARVRRGRAGRLHGNREGRRRDRAAHGCRPQGAAGTRPQRSRALSVADGRRDAPLPRIPAPRDRQPLLLSTGARLQPVPPVKPAPQPEPSMKKYQTLISADELARILGDPQLSSSMSATTSATTSLGQRKYREGHIPGAHFLSVETDLADRIPGRTAGIRCRRSRRSPRRCRRSASMRRSRSSRTTAEPARTRAAVVDAALARTSQRRRARRRLPRVDGAGLPVDRHPRRKPAKFVPKVSESPVIVATLAQHRDEPDYHADRCRGRRPLPRRERDDRSGCRHISPDRAAGRSRRTSTRTRRSRIARRCGPSLSRRSAAEARADRPHLRLGVTACNNLLAMEHAGLSGSRLYPGRGASGAAIPRDRSQSAEHGPHGRSNCGSTFAGTPAGRPDVSPAV